jgi:hypothetical protein
MGHHKRKKPRFQRASCKKGRGWYYGKHKQSLWDGVIGTVKPSDRARLQQSKDKLEEWEYSVDTPG